jgi:iron complex transport system permease protein
MIASEIKMQAQTVAEIDTRASGSRWRVVIFFVVAASLLLALIVLGVSIGSTHVPAAFVARVLLAHLLPSGWLDLGDIGQSQQAIIWQLRAPRVIVAALAGASLAVAGTMMQGLFRNPLASPDIVGTSAGGALGAVVAMASGAAMRNVLALPLFSFVGSLVALLAVYLIATRRGRTPVATLLLAGVALSALFSAANSLLISLTWVRWEVAQEITFWLMGGLDNRHWLHCLILLPCAAVGLGVALGYGRELDLLLLGEETALALGVEVERTRRILLVNAALLTGAAVAVSGVIGFVGLISPHLARLLIGPSHRRLLPASVLTGAIFLLAADLVARTLIRPEEVRLGIVTAGFGAPFFLLLLLRHQRSANY